MSGADWRSKVFRSLDEFEVLNLLPHEEVIWVGDWKDGDRKWFWVSDATCKKLNQSRAELLNMELNNGHSQSMNEHMHEVYAKVQCAGETFSLIKTVHPGGKPCHWLQTFRPIRVHLPEWAEERTLFMLETRDVDEAREGSGKSSEWERLTLGSALLEYSESISLMFDAATEELMFANQQGTTFYETALESGGRRLQRLSDVFARVEWASADEKQSIVHAVRSLKLESQRIEVEGRMASAGSDGTEQEVWHHLVFIPSLNPVNSHLSIIVNQRDITKLHQQSRQLIAIYREQEAAKQRQEFFSAVSHELRTPLNGILGLTDSLLNSPECSSPKVLQSLRVVHSSGQRLAALVSDVLDAAASHRGRFAVKRERILLAELAQRESEKLQDSCRRGVAIRVDIDAALSRTHIEGDGARIAQAVSHLVSNALKFTERGHVTLRARLLPGEEVLVEVEDTGCGIPEGRWQQVWHPFTQVDMSDARRHGGTGLGLSLVKEIIEAHGGRVGLRSCTTGPRRGSTFWLALPLRQPEEEEDEAAGAASHRFAFARAAPPAPPENSPHAAMLHRPAAPIDSGLATCAPRSHDRPPQLALGGSDSCWSAPTADATRGEDAGVQGRRGKAMPLVPEGLLLRHLLELESLARQEAQQREQISLECCRSSSMRQRLG